ncbi:MAG: hypothetical protein Q8O50_07830 [Hydrogenophaga sp.]|nr:hypothetical protein [Hydrogenophaga sp.]
MTSQAPQPRLALATALTRLVRTTGLALTLGALGALGGCAGVLLVDNQVESFANWTPTTAGASTAAVPSAPQAYRFERLPSQREGRSARGQDELEALAQAALTKAGWTAVAPDTSAPWRVQVSANTQRLPRAPWEDPWVGPWGGGFWGDPWNRYGAGVGISAGRGHYVGAGGQFFWAPMFMHVESPYYQRELALVIRRADNGQVVYETRAAHDSRWNSTPSLWAAMLDAALQGFPTPPGGPRQVNVEIPR